MERTVEKVPPPLARIYQACYHCFRPADNGVSLKRCSRCRRVSYDSTDCQKANWKRHKEFCAAYSTLHADIMTIDPPSAEPTTDVAELNRRAEERAQDKLRVLMFTLGRDLTTAERNLVGWEPRCLACARTEEDVRALAGNGAPPAQPLIPCTHCKFSFYCSDAHRAFAQDTHENDPDPDAASGLSQCAINRTVREDALVRGAVQDDEGPLRWAPERTLPRWTPLAGKTWDSEFREELQRSVPLPPHALAPFLRFASDGLAWPMTIMWGLERLNEGDAWTKKNTLTIHMIGASQEETMRAMIFEEIMHRLPEVKTLNLVLCGPDMAFMLTGDAPMDMDTCPTCHRRGRKRIHTHITSTYHEYVEAQGSKFAPPDLAIAFNSGCGSVETQLWEPTLSLLAARKIPSLFTAFNREEMLQDGAVLERAGAHLVPGLAGPNPWGSQSLLTEPNKVRGFYSSSGFISGGFRG